MAELEHGGGEDWRDIPGYGGMYQIDRMGQVRSWRWRGDHRARHPRLLVPYKRKRRGKGRQSNRVYVKLTDPSGRSAEVAVIGLMADVWLGGRPTGKVAYHKNGDLMDNCANNIGFIAPEALGHMTGAGAKRKPVAKINHDGETVAVYPSARAAARAKKPFALDGHTYCYEE